MNKKQLIVIGTMVTYFLVSFIVLFVSIRVIPDIATDMPANAKVPLSLIVFIYFVRVVRMLFLPILIIGGLLIYVLRDKK